MTDDPNKPQSPWKLNSSRVVLLVLGALLLVYVIAAFSGSLTNYQLVKEGAQDAQIQKQAPATTSP